ncbi:MAG: hypothetical protein ABJI96_14860 [Paracoccaceae bacterium]
MTNIRLGRFRGRPKPDLGKLAKRFIAVFALQPFVYLAFEMFEVSIGELSDHANTFGPRPNASPSYSR